MTLPKSHIASVCLVESRYLISKQPLKKTLLLTTQQKHEP